MQLTRVIAILAALALLVPTGIADWSQFRHDDEHTSLADQAGAIQTPYERWTFDADGSIASSPAVTTVDGDTTIVVGSYPAQNTPGTVYAITPEGETLWSTTPAGSTGGYIASPTVEDLDGDDVKEVVVPSLDDSTLRVFNARDGSQEWSAQVGDTSSDLLASSPVVADLDDTDGKEIALGGSTSDQDGSLLIYDDDGDQLQAIELDGPAWSTPLYEDLDGDDTRELVLATGVPDTLSQLFPSAKTGGESLYAFERSGTTWSIDWQVDLSGPALGSPTAEDLDADGTPEIVVGAQGGHFYAVEPDGTVQADHEATVGPLVAISSPAIADVDDDGVPEVSVGVSNGIQSLELTSEGFVDDGKIALPSVDGQDPWVAASPAVADIDGDEDPDLLGSTVPINVSDEVVNSDALPGRVFAVDGASLADADTQPRWSVSFPDDGGISGPIPADVDDDGRSEVLAGEGIPIIGNASTLHYVDAGNPVVEEIAIDPSEPTTQDTVTFDADATDESNDDASLSYAWDFGDGTTSEAETPTHSFADDGTYNVSVTVTDPDGHAWTETTQVQVDNVPPDVTGTVDTTPGSLEATVTGTADDPDGTVEETTWAFGDGQTATTDETTHTYPTGGTYTANFTAVDDDGDARTVQKTVDVNRFPSLDGNETAATAEGETLTVALAADDPDGDPVRVTDVEGPTGARADLTAPDEVTLTWTPDYDVTNRSDTPATTDITVTVEDAGTPTGTAEASVSVDVENTNRPPSLTGPEQARASSGQTTVLDGQADDADGNDVTLSAEGLPASASFAADGEEWRITVQPPSDAAETTHTVTIQADDGQDVTEHQIELEIVPNRPPEASIAGPTETQADTRWSPNPVTFEGQASDPDGDAIRRWSWNVSGVYRSGAEVTQAFDEHGTYKVELTAKDTQLAADTTARNVTVDDALTGDLVVHRAHQGPNVPRLVHATVTYDDGTPLAGTAVDVAMRHEGLDLVTQQREVVTDADGSLVVELDGDVGGLFVPGEHTVSVTTQAPSLASAPIQDTETLAMEDRFAVGLG